jgi:hypothetical protein
MHPFLSGPFRAEPWQKERARHHRGAQGCASRLIFHVKLNNKRYLPENVGKLFLRTGKGVTTRKRGSEGRTSS